MNIFKKWLQNKLSKMTLKELVSRELTQIRREMIIKKNSQRMYYKYKYGENFKHFI